MRQAVHAAAARTTSKTEEENVSGSVLARSSPSTCVWFTSSSYSLRINGPTIVSRYGPGTRWNADLPGFIMGWELLVHTSLCHCYYIFTGFFFRLRDSMYTGTFHFFEKSLDLRFCISLH